MLMRETDMSAKERQLQVDYSRDIAPLQQVRDAALSRRASEFYERALADSKEALLSALDITDVIVYLKDPAGRYILMSPWYEEQFHNNKRFEGKTDYDFFPKKRADEFRKNDEMAVKAGKLMEFHEVLVHQNREDRAISFKFPIFDHEGTLCGVCGFATPLVTDRNQAKKARKKSEDFYSAIFNAIRESEVRYQTLFESANDAVCLIKGDFFIDCNRKALEIFGCQRRDIIAKPFLRFSPLKQPNGEDSHTEVGKKISAAKQGIEQRFEWRCCRNDGTEFDSEVILNKVEVLGKKYIQAVIRDVTERKHAKEKKRQMLKTLRAFMDNSPAFIYVKDKECKYIDVNRRIMELFAVPKEAFVGKSDYDFFQKGVADIFYASDLRVLKGEAVEYEVVVEFSNRKVVFIDNKFPLKDERGKPYAICGIATNITEMKEAEKSVKESEERYRTLANHVADGVMLVQHRLLTFVNDALVTMMNCENRESLVGAAAADFFAEEDRDRFLTMCDSLISGLTTKEVLEAQCVIKDAKKFWTEGHYRTISWQGQPAVLGTVRDITDFKLREQAMQEETAHVRNELVKLKSSLKDRYRMGNIERSKRNDDKRNYTGFDGMNKEIMGLENFA